MNERTLFKTSLASYIAIASCNKKLKVAMRVVYGIIIGNCSCIYKVNYS